MKIVKINFKADISDVEHKQLLEEKKERDLC
jgi:hypothetical protein